MSTGVIACGALAADVRRIATRRGWEVDVHPIDALLHNRPALIAPALERSIQNLRDDYDTRVLWLAQRPTPATRAAVQRAAGRIGLPLCEREVGNSGLEHELERVITS